MKTLNNLRKTCKEQGFTVKKTNLILWNTFEILL